MSVVESRMKELQDLVLLKGAHPSSDKGMCVMEAVAYVAGEPHSDHPACASPVIAALLRRCNDTSGRRRTSRAGRLRQLW